MSELILTTAPLRCSVCGLLPLGEHERTRPDEEGSSVCGTCYRLQRLLAHYDEPLADLQERLGALEAKAEATDERP